MPTQTDVQLTAAATVIQNEVAANANTATRVGTILNNIVENKINNDKIVISVTGASDANVASEKAVKTYADTKQAALGFTPENAANKSVNIATDTGSDTKYPSVKAVQDAIALAGGLPYKIYAASFSQSGNAAPTPVIYSNTIGSIVWTYLSSGTFKGTLAGAFLLGKMPKIEGFIRFGTSFGSGFINSFIIQRLDNDSIAIGSFRNGTATDDLLSSQYFEIKVYP